MGQHCLFFLESFQFQCFHNNKGNRVGKGRLVLRLLEMPYQVSAARDRQQEEEKKFRRVRVLGPTTGIPRIETLDCRQQYWLVKSIWYGY